MKNEQRSTPPSQPSHHAARHQFDHAIPTVIHHPEEDLTALQRYAHRAMEDPVKFWTWTGIIVFGVIAIVVVSNLWSSERSAAGDVWVALEQAKDTDRKVEIARENPDSPAASWALLQAATDYYSQGFADLPSNRDVALPTLKKALDLFDQVVKESPKDSPQARHAALGKARTLEARNELKKAVEEYKLVAKTWPGSPEAARAEKLAKAIENPSAEAFYKELYAYKPTQVTLPPLGTELIPAAPDSTSGAVGTDSPSSAPTSLLPSPPPEPTPVPNKEVEAAPKTTPSVSDSSKLKELEGPAGDAKLLELPAPPAVPKTEDSAPKSKP
jgi:hypothetical protein